MREVEAELLPAQMDLVEDETSAIVGLVGGMGSGKTRAAVFKALALCTANPGLPGILVEPTYALIRDVAVRTFEEVLGTLGVPYTWHGTHHVLTIGRGRSASTVDLRSGDRPERLVGGNYAWGIIDEPGLQTEEVAQRVLQRIREPRARVRQLVLTGTPEGLGWLYAWLVADPKPGSRIIRARTADNPYLPAGYVPNLAASMSPEQRRAYLDGEFCSLLGGTVYDAFSRAEHCRPCANPTDGEIVVGADFNVDLMSWPVGRIVGEELHIWGEVTTTSTNTDRQADALIEFLQDALVDRWGQRPTRAEVARRVTIHCDATGAAKKTAATKSDLAILREKGFTVVAPSSNPAVKDRVHSVNARMRPRPPHLFIDPAAAPRLTKALEQQVWRDGAPEKGNGLDASTDALGYIVHQHWPLSSPRGNATRYA